MVSGHDEDSQLARALAAAKPYPTGWFRLYFEDERWEWSPEVERLHGYEPGTAKPTTSVVLSHKHPEDYEQVEATLDDIRRTHQPFSTRHRIIDVQGRIHVVIVVAELLRDDGGEVIGTNGFYVDVTFPPEERESFISEAVADIAANRAVIEQVKGILMIVYRIDADARSTSSNGGRRQPTSSCGCWPNSSWPIFGHSTTTTPCPHAQCSTNYC